jgi:hypothetical protein
VRGFPSAFLGAQLPAAFAPLCASASHQSLSPGLGQDFMRFQHNVSTRHN